MKNTLARNRRAISPVIATVILVAVAITISIAAAYWMGGIAGGYTKFEKVEIQTGYSAKTSDSNYWIVTLELKNTGSASSTLGIIFINDLPLNATSYGKTSGVPGQICTDIGPAGRTLTSGNSTSVHVWIPTSSSLTLSSGTTINVKVHSAGGMDYIKLIELV